MKVSYKVQKVETVEKTVPDHFSYDESPRGLVVDILIGKDRRDDLYSDNKDTVESAIFAIGEAYDKATKIVAIFCRVGAAA